MKLSYKKTCGLSQGDIEKTAATLDTYRNELSDIANRDDYESHESSLRLSFDASILDESKELLKKKKTPTLQFIVVIGIGGSNLGTRAVYRAMAGTFNLFTDRIPKVLFLDTVSEEKLTMVVRKFLTLTDKGDFLIISVTKSGTTTETIANTEALLSKLDDHFGDVRDRLVTVTQEGSKLWKAATEQKIDCLPIPKPIGGRYSVFSHVGMFPLLAAGINTTALQEGARKAIKDNLSDNLNKNASLVSAAATFLHYKKGIRIHNTFLFAPELGPVGKWYRQLMGESLGKDGEGITPIVSVGSTDLHSVAQLYYGGPNDKFTNMVIAPNQPVAMVPRRLRFPGLVEDIQGKALAEIMNKIAEGVQTSYQKNGLPFLSVELNGINEKELGYYLQFRMIEMMYLGKLMHVNAFDQPAVEEYKSETRRLLHE